MHELNKYKFLGVLSELPFVEEIYLYGSRARGDNSPRSDIDLAILCPQASNSQWHELMDIIDNADTLLEIDCVRFDKLKSDDLLKKNIEKNHIILFKREENGR